MRYFYSFFAVLLTSLLLTPLVRATVDRLGIVDHPREDRWHCRPVALMGGIAIFLSFGVSLFWMGDLRELAVLLLGGAGIFLIGLIDDATNASPFFKLAGQLAIGIVVPILGIRPDIFPWPAANIALAVFWIVGITNAMNLIDGLDGLAAGVALLVSLALGVLAWRAGNVEVLVLCAAVAGASLGFLWYNFSPASIFMGDCGALFLGYMLAVLAIKVTSNGDGSSMVRALPPLMALSVPIFDTTFVTITRIVARKPPWKGGRDHTFYRLAFRWKDAKRAVLAFYALAFVSALLTIVVSRASFPLALTIALVWAAILVALAVALGRLPVVNGSISDEMAEP